MTIFSSSVNFLEGIYIICLTVGFILSVLGIAFGGHGGHMSHVGHAQFGDSHSMGHLTHANMQSTNNSNIANEGASVYTAPILNIQAIFAFLLGFGAGGLVGFQVFNRLLLTLPLAIVGGIAFWWVVRAVITVMLRNQTAYLDIKDNDVVGITGLVITKISQDSMGEIMYLLQGTDRIIRAKAFDGGQINKGESVVIVKVERGVAYVTSADSFGRQKN
ncbi:hypothetical protein Desaci_2158 [Desulfosporosinus acidiphilus SJ4]|uniref:NfeD-like C-terminal domain-containing protein n=1 Tax=Desulfosporosinus acidiphilus (strain DSM 22704 / JCM 16185 / SJ4) TaxID=646529 RepID=I4D5P7_DESAJ|nr:NfeD family protein [Desulfosporosinus acidiphilus]AFM41121.1 hypothetical protein Desaci_2158 [Desulfosporosinus acidiphilus SJ4]